MTENYQELTLNCTSPESAESLIWAVRKDRALKSKAKFLLSSGQLRELKELRKAAKRPNETPLNYKAFIAILLAGGLLYLGFTFATGLHLSYINIIPPAIGVLVVTMAGAVAILGLPSHISNAGSLNKLQVRCDYAWVESLRALAEKY